MHPSPCYGERRADADLAPSRCRARWRVEETTPIQTAFAAQTPVLAASVTWRTPSEPSSAPEADGFRRHRSLVQNHSHRQGEHTTYPGSVQHPALRGRHRVQYSFAGREDLRLDGIGYAIRTCRI